MNILKKMTDEQLVNAYMEGNDNAFDVLLERHKDRLYSYILYHVRNSDTADDIFQETFVKVIVHLKQQRYVESGKFYAWLSRIAHNLIIDLFRTEQSNNCISNDEAGTDIYNSVQVSQACIETEIVTEQTLDDIKKMIEFLPENQKEIVKMRYYEDLSFKEISDIKGVSINTALGRMRYAILNMRKMAVENNLFLSIG